MQESSIEILQGKSVLLVNFANGEYDNTVQYIANFDFSSNLADSLAQSQNYLKAKQYDLVICYWQNNNDEYIKLLISHIRSNKNLFKLPIVVILNIIAPNLINQAWYN
ncbi:hypothetical protein RI844_19780 [Thalassotalea fonticola]|uniref:Response regulator n=1 Tax=Thalassotalea fonticola TaxID=3065649 RepID=A0ABZ0GP17_9GAMM|nr:hypothetical protein RI844_19780 [Colwelliaceae bacterium S1-1]